MVAFRRRSFFWKGMSVGFRECKATFALQVVDYLPADGEMQDSELNSLLQGQWIHIENCTDVRISVRQLEVEKVVELCLAALPLLEHQVAGKAPAGDGVDGSKADLTPQRNPSGESRD